MCRPAHRCWRTRGRWRKRSKPPRRAATTTSALQSGSVTGAALITICKLWQILFSSAPAWKRFSDYGTLKQARRSY